VLAECVLVAAEVAGGDLERVGAVWEACGVERFAGELEEEATGDVPVVAVVEDSDQDLTSSTAPTSCRLIL